MEGNGKTILSVATLIIVLLIVVLWIYHPGTTPPNGSPPVPPIPDLHATAPNLRATAPTQLAQKTPTTVPCNHVHQIAGVLPPLDITNLRVSDGCVLIVEGDQGTINGTAWSSGGVLAFHPGTYNGLLSNGEYDIVATDGAKQVFCSFVNQRNRNHQGLSRKMPLPEWGNC
jgi:hypothetical protein